MILPVPSDKILIRFHGDAVIPRCQWLVSKEYSLLAHELPILSFKPVLIGCQYGLLLCSDIFQIIFECADKHITESL